MLNLNLAETELPEQKYDYAYVLYIICIVSANNFWCEMKGSEIL